MNFKQHFEYLWSRIFIQKLPTAFARYADGQVSIIQNKVINKTQDEWVYLGCDKFNNDISNTLNHIQQDYYYAISCSCCDIKAKQFLLQKIKSNKITYANLWINGNYKIFKERISKINQQIILVGNHIGQNIKFPFNVSKYIPISSQRVTQWKDNSEKTIDALIQSIHNVQNPLVLMSAGPVSQILIDKAYSYKKGRYIDVGSSLDQFIFKKKTRPYMLSGTFYYNKDCIL